MIECHQKEHGFYVAIQESEACGISIAFAYIDDIRDIQFSLQIGWIILAIGYTFR